MSTTANKTYSNYNKVLSIKATKRNWEHIVLVKNNNSYEAYEEDADQVTGICGVGQFNRKGCLLNITAFGEEMLNTYLAKLIRAGHKVSIYDPKA